MRRPPLEQVDPLRSSALLGLAKHGESVEFLGTAFAYRSGRHFVTAAHCVGDLEASAFSLSLPLFNLVRPVAQIIRHPTADVAILALDEDIAEVEPFIDQTLGAQEPELGLGLSFLAFGYPEDFLDIRAIERRPTLRMFTGSIQRYFPYQSFAGYGYLAAELSIPAPTGLSGGPLVLRDLPRVAFGLVADNVETTTQLHSEEIIEDDGTRRVIQTRSVINYGVAVLVGPIMDWLDQHLSSRGAAWKRAFRL